MAGHSGQYSDELSRRGFQAALIESMEEDDDPVNEARRAALRKLRESCVPHFLYSRLAPLGVMHTIAFDEQGDVWISYEKDDLSSIGFAYFDYDKGQLQAARRMC